ncbi:hypothetical protein K438DRAFT_1757454 [Mycena galopus ATCC 62051]|nr:hypothetical protein K438DRAFT_1757454 [Mycena galopus ATCC 62051]
MWFDPNSSSLLDSFDATNVRLIEKQIEGKAYKIHRFFLFRDSPVLREMPPDPVESFEPVAPGDDLDLTYTLRGVSKEEFEHLLWLYYNPSIEYYLAPIAVWRDILKLAEMWKMTRVVYIAQKHLRNAEIDPIEIIKLCERDHHAAREAYIQIGTRKESLSATEFQTLGMDLVLLIMQIRERIIANRGASAAESLDEGKIVDGVINPEPPRLCEPPGYC